MLKNLLPASQSDPNDTLPSHDVVLYDETNSRSVLNLVPEAIKSAALQALALKPDLFELDEDVLRKKVAPSDSVLRIRMAFWNEYFRVQDHGLKEMSAAKIYAGIVHHKMFYGKILSDPKAVAWILCIPTNYMIAMEELLDRGMRNLSRIMGMAVVDELGQVDVKRASIFLKTYEMVQERVRGSVVQKVANANFTMPLPNGEADDMRKQLEELRAKREALPVDIEVNGEADEE